MSDFLGNPPARRRPQPDQAGTLEMLATLFLVKTKPQIALDQIRAAHATGVAPGIVLADAGYGVNGGFHAGVTALDLPYIVGVQSTLTVWPPGQRPLPSKPWNGHGRKPSRLNRDLEHQPVTVKELALSLKKKAWRTLTWREGSNTPLTSRFAAVRLRPASRDYNRTKPHPVEWLIVEWPNGEAEPTKYWLSTLPKDTPLQDLDDCGPCVVVIGSRPGLLFCRTASLCLIVTGTEGQPPSLSGKLDAPPVSSPIAFRRRQLDRAFRRHRLFRQIKQDGSSSGSNGITRNGSWLDMANSPFSRRNVSTAASPTSTSQTQRPLVLVRIAAELTPKACASKARSLPTTFRPR